MENINDDDKQFLLELAALLKKYNASIDWNCGPCSDTHGIYDETMSISRRISPNSSKEKTLLEIDGSCLDADNINENS